MRFNCHTPSISCRQMLIPATKVKSGHLGNMHRCFLQCVRNRIPPTRRLLSTEPEVDITTTGPPLKKWEYLNFVKRPKERRPRPQNQRRSGAIALKVGMLGVYDTWGQRHTCTVLQLNNNQAVQPKIEDTDGYCAQQIGAGEKKYKNVNKPDKGHLDNFGVGPRRKLGEFRVTPNALIPPASPILAQHFVPGQLLDVCGISKNKGFAGVMKRWGFKGQSASHGTSLAHRSLGSTGQNTSPGKVFKGKKMPGQLGHARVTVQNLWLYKIDTEDNLLYVKGCTPGANGTWVRVTDAIKGAHWPVPPPMPTFVPEEGIKYPKEITAPVPEIDPLIPPEGQE